MNDYRGTTLKEGDKVAIYWGYNSLETAVIHSIKGNKCKVKVTYHRTRYLQDGRDVYTEDVISKWKSGDCMVKLPD